MAVYNGVARTLLDRALAAVADGEPDDTDRLIVLLHAESQQTRDVLCEESRRTRNAIAADGEQTRTKIDEASAETRKQMHRWVGLKLFGHDFTPIELAIITGAALGSTGIGVAELVRAVAG